MAPQVAPMIPADAPRFDLVVVGAGVNGAAIAREAALRGLRVMIVERCDLASGTSAASTRLIHGGLRYLEHAEFGLVRESLRERERLLELAPHLVRPLELQVPIYRRSRRRKWQIRIGMLLYDWLSFDKSLPRHRMLSRAETLAAVPALAAEGLLGSAFYYDAQIEYPERLIVELLQDALTRDTVLATYARVEAIVVVGGTVRGIAYRRADGTLGHAASDVVVNATGPWVDELVSGLTSKRLIGGTRGSHLVATAFTGAPATALYVEAVSDARPFFIIPWNGLYLIGTTDLRFDGDPSAATIGADELAYLLEEARQAIPAATDLRAKLCYAQTGIRPLPHRERGEEGAITRRHLIRHHRAARGLYSIVGGKLTTHRALAEDLLHRLCRRRPAWPRESPTRTRALPGAIAGAERAALEAELAAAFGLEHARRLLRVYGANARRILAAARAAPELATALAPRSHVLVAELNDAFEHEWARNLGDFLLRRCMAGLNPRCGLDEVEAAARWLRQLGLCDAAAAERMADEYRGYVRRFDLPER